MRRVVITFILAIGLGVAAFAKPPRPPNRPATTNAFVVGLIDSPAIEESSGIVASRQHAGVFWTHNDSGNPATIYAIGRDGKLINEFDIRAKNRDWEDIAIDDDGHLYVGEIGNNNGRHGELAVFRIDEPDPHKPLPAGASLPVTQTWRLTFPDKPFDCESLFVWKNTGYVVSKRLDGGLAGLYRFPLEDQTKPAVLEKVAELAIRFPCTGADLSPDGKRLAVQSVGGPYLFNLPAAGDVAGAGKIIPKHVFFTDVRMESICFVDEGLLATTESRMIYLFRWKDFGNSDPGNKATEPKVKSTNPLQLQQRSGQ